MSKQISGRKIVSPRKKKCTLEEVAQRIVGEIHENTSPGNCTWGDEFPEAHEELFRTYWADMVNDVIKILTKEN